MVVTEEQKEPVITNVMGDLNNFMICEDLRVNEQEDKFIRQQNFNAERDRFQNQLRQELSFQLQRNTFEDIINDSKDIVFDSSDIADLQSPVQDEVESRAGMNLQNQIKNLDSIFEPEPEIIEESEEQLTNVIEYEEIE